MCLGPDYIPMTTKPSTLWERVYSFANLHLAYLKARRSKRYNQDILQFGFNLEANLLRLRDELKHETYRHGSYKKFTAHDSKKRHIMAAPFKDRVMHHALCNIIEPIFDPCFIFDSYACRKNKGTHAAISRLRKFTINQNYPHLYVFKGDICKYFNSVDHEILFDLIREKIREEPMLRLIWLIIDSANQKTGKGIPIGNLTSQLFANIYLNKLDQHIKHSLRVKKYIRYMDDFLIFDTNKHKLTLLKEQIGAYLSHELELELHPRKSTIFPVRLGVDFLGYVFFKDQIRLRKSTLKRFMKRTNNNLKRLANGQLSDTDFARSIESWRGYAKHAHTWQLRRSLAMRYGLFHLTTSRAY